MVQDVHAVPSGLPAGDVQESEREDEAAVAGDVSGERMCVCDGCLLENRRGKGVVDDESASISCRFHQFSSFVVILESFTQHSLAQLSNKHSNSHLFSLFFSKGR